MRTIGISPKVIASAVTGLLIYVLTTHLGIEVDTTIVVPGVDYSFNLRDALQIVGMVVAGYLAPSGTVEFSGVEDEVDGNVPGGSLPAEGEVDPGPSDLAAFTGVKPTTRRKTV